MIISYLTITMIQSYMIMINGKAASGLQQNNRTEEEDGRARQFYIEFSYITSGTRITAACAAFFF